MVEQQITTAAELVALVGLPLPRVANKAGEHYMSWTANGSGRRRFVSSRRPMIRALVTVA